ncbi:Exodeoxyribonuclease 7 large subunit [Chlamydia avium]|nr:exodeoxyribonuclease VII large subunit [Chlamydia avium]EPP35943.1 exodeoxyribonuclease VII, large subunit [Chlamydia psittaci 10_743_SC13]EPP38370.1 exodeoxyribonuclease VII, large subunit [Chlamydia avium]VVT42613.1 Exodeoxyribonuclease 7 large subunit [Chlamydia avium]
MFPSSPPQAVTTLTESIKNLLESNFCQIVVKGELSNVSLQSSGHLYFGIKDNKSFLHGAFFHFKSRYFDRHPKDGDFVILHGKLAVYAPRGQYQIIAHALIYAGEGDLVQKLEETKKRLASAGYFSQERKRALPNLPQRIGVITSPTGAVIQDILRILSRRCHQYKLLLYPVTVQGETAAKEITKAIEVMNEENLADVLILARGGGSIEDLWAFNEEILVKAVATSTLPIISAVGHETDYTLCDFAADVRAPTPSAAAEIVCQSSEQLLHALQNSLNYLHTHAQQFLSAKTQQLLQWRRQLDRIDLFHSSQQSLDYLRQAADRLMQAKLLQSIQSYKQSSRWLQNNFLQRINQRLHDVSRMLHASMCNQLFNWKHRYFHIKRNLISLNREHPFSHKLFLWNLQICRALRQRLQSSFYFLNYKQKQLSHRALCLNQKIFQGRQSLTNIDKRIVILITNQLNACKTNIMFYDDTLYLKLHQNIERNKEKYLAICKQLFSLSPKHVLQRGYAMLFDFNKNCAIISARSLRKHHRVKVRLQDGEAILSVEDTQYC